MYNPINEILTSIHSTEKLTDFKLPHEDSVCMSRTSTNIIYTFNIESCPTAIIEFLATLPVMDINCTVGNVITNIEYMTTHHKVLVSLDGTPGEETTRIIINARW